jgi:hypothetical protein
VSKHKYYLLTYPQLENRTTIVRSIRNDKVKVIATSTRLHWDYLNVFDLKYVLFRNKNILEKWDVIARQIKGKELRQEAFRIQMLNGMVNFKVQLHRTQTQ